MSDIEQIEAGLVESFERYRSRVGPRTTILGGPPPNDAELTPLMDALNRTEAFPPVNGWWIWARGRQNVLTPGWLATWAFPSWRSKDELKTTAEKIYRVVTTRNASISLYTAVWGAAVSESANISDHLSIHPFEEQLTRQASEFTNEGLANPVRFLGAYRTAVDGPPRSALRNRFADFPFLSDNPANQSNLAQDLIEQSNNACLSLVTFGTLSSIVDLSWFEYEESALDDVWYESNRFWRMPEVLPTTVRPTPVNLPSFVSAHGALMGLPRQQQSKLMSSIKRFDLSLARRSVGDQAIDLCTAFEQLLGSGGEGGISWSNGLRCAALIGGNNATRLATRDTVHMLYRIRNNWVHGGEAGPTVTSKTMGVVPTADAIQRARSIYSDMLRVLIAAGDNVDWFALETTGSL
jgi:hypothetical protein